MIHPEDETLIDLRTSCTKEEAVAKMIGWMQGPLRRKYVEVTEHGISSEQLTHMFSLDEPLEAQLGELREAARQKLIDAAESDGEILEAYVALDQCDDLIKKAASYLLDIEDELDRSDLSELRIDQEATNKTGVIHLRLRSVDQWARKNYDISILDDTKSNDDNTNVISAQSIDQLEDIYTKPLDKRTEESLYTTFAFLVDAYVQSDKSFLDQHGKLNVMALTDTLVSIARAANKGESLSGQGTSSIQRLITNAMHVKSEKLKK